MTESSQDATPFLNVDLDLFSSGDLQPLIAAMGAKVEVLHVGRNKRIYVAHLELAGAHVTAAGRPGDPETVILGFCKLIRALKPAERAIWDAAKTRIFDIGIEAPEAGHRYQFAFSQKAMKAASEVNAQFALSVYGPKPKVKARMKAPSAK
jgi:hypothetical protein